MNPPSSVSGWYFAHSEAKYFYVGQIDRDQVEDSRRKDMPVEVVEKWLQPNLGYEGVVTPKQIKESTDARSSGSA